MFLGLASFFAATVSVLDYACLSCKHSANSSSALTRIIETIQLSLETGTEGLGVFYATKSTNHVRSLLASVSCFVLVMLTLHSYC